MSFDKLYNNWFLSESVLDIPRDGLDPSVFQFPEVGAPIINNRIKQQIIRGVEQVHSIIPVLDYFVIGSILTPKYNDFSDIDINCEVQSVPNATALENIISLLKNINGSLAIGTQHPINLFVVQGEYDLSKTEAAYDIANDRWIKEPNVQTFNVRKFMGRIKNEFSTVDLATAELRRDLIDFKELDSLSDDDIGNLEHEIKLVLSNIEADVTSIIKMYDNAKLLRKNAFDKTMTPKEIRSFGEKNNLPANVLYKMLERYYYKDLVAKLKDSIGEDEVVEKEDIPDIKKTFQDFLDKI